MASVACAAITSTSESDPPPQPLSITMPSADDRTTTASISEPDPQREEDQASTPYNWLEECINGGSLHHIDLHGCNGWTSPPGDLFNLRSATYLSSRKKCPSGDYLLRPAGVDWFRSISRLDNVLARPDNRISSALRQAHALDLALEAFIFAVNLQIPSGTCKCHSAVFYFTADEPISPDSLLYQFINGDDTYRNSRFKLVNRVIKGPWIVQKTTGKYPACILGKALKCTYHRGDNYLEVDVDIGSSEIASTAVLLALGFVRQVRVDLGFVVEAKSDEELPERLVGAVRISQVEMKAAQFVESAEKEKGK